MEESGTPHVLHTKKDFDDFLYKAPYFAFLDILGFSNLVRKNSHDTLVKLYNQLFSAMVSNVEEKWKDIARAKAEKLGDKYTDAGIRMVNISDSIMIWTSHGQPTALYEITQAVSTLLSLSLFQGLPLRGCITRQPFSVIEDKSVLSVVGMGLVQAYGLEKSQQWSGCIMDEEIIRYFRSIEKVLFHRDAPSPIERRDLVVEYNIPLVRKGIPIREKGYAVDWSSPLITDAMIREAFDAHQKKDERPDSDTPDKITHTVEFHDFCLAKKAAEIAALAQMRQALGAQDPDSN